MHYFAYGSNMALARLRQRVPGARRMGVCSLNEHRLHFHKIGSDGSGKCDALYTGDKGHLLPGVLFEIDPRHKPHLDAVEGLGHGYDEKWVNIKLSTGERCRAFTYYALHIDTSLKPFSWYKHHVLTGARESGLPEAHILMIEAVQAIEDPDSHAARREWAIHGR